MLRSPPRTGAASPPRPHGRSRGADAVSSAATDGVLGWEGAALLPCPPPERSAVPSPAQPSPALPGPAACDARSQSVAAAPPAPVTGTGRRGGKEGADPARPLPPNPAKYGGTAATPRGSGGWGGGGSERPPPHERLRGRAKPQPGSPGGGVGGQARLPPRLRASAQMCAAQLLYPGKLQGNGAPDPPAIKIPREGLEKWGAGVAKVLLRA